MPKQKIDCLLIHVPKNLSDEVSFGMIISMGVFALADILHRNGYSSRIIHLGIEKIKNNNFSIENYIKDKEIIAIGFSLHWYFQSYDTIQLVNRIKSIRPEIKIVLGGFTASFFANDIMENFNNVDFVIKGEGEIPLLQLMNELSRVRKDFSSVPNLIWRHGNKIIQNNCKYVANNKDLDNLNFTNFELLENFSVYSRIGLSSKCHFYKEESLSNYKIFSICVGRGCNVNCSFCGGAKLSQKLINNRTKVTFRSAERVFEDIERAALAGFDEVYICFDPRRRRDYFKRLFHLIRKSKIDIRMKFGCWLLPPKDFIDEFKKTFMDGSSFEISPETGSERLRKLNKGYFFTNKELVSTLAYLKKNKIKGEIYFSFPLPFTTKTDLEQTDSFINLLKTEFGNFHKVITHRLSFAPASPMFIYPARYNINKNISNFFDYYNPPKKPNYLLRGIHLKDFKKMFGRYDREEKVFVGMLPKARAYFNLKSYEKAIETANKVIEFDPKMIDAYFLLGSCYEQTKRNDNTLEVYKKALKIFPNEGTIYLRLASAYFNLKRYEEAIKKAKRVIELNYKEGNIHLLLGVCYEKIKQYKKAIAELKKAEKISPEEPQVNFSLSNCYRNIGQRERFDKEIDKGIIKLKRIQQKTTLN